jgi:putative transposase
MSSYRASRSCLSFEQALASFHNDKGLPFAEVLPAIVVAKAFADEEVDFGDTADSVFTPAVVLWAFLSQALEEDKSCRAAVSRIQAQLVASGKQPCSLDTGDYCRARAKIPCTVLERLALEAGGKLESLVPTDWLWHGRHVTLVDGTTLTMADTVTNQAAYPQQASQAPGCGFPIMRMVVLLSLASGSLTGMATAPYQGKETGETALLRRLFTNVQPGQILLADRFYCTYWLVAMAQALGVDVVFRMHHKRDYDFRRGERLGMDDHVATWNRPQCPDWMNQATYATMPVTLTMRELRVNITTPGCRTGEVVIATTLTDAESFSKEDVADLYHDRWHVELDIRAIKQSLHLDPLRCKSPFMIDKELWVHLLAYNLTRKVSCQAALLQEVYPRQVSFTATKQSINATRSQLTQATPSERVDQSRSLLDEIGKERVGNRPDRVEPRRVKRRPKPYKRLKKPRAEARAELFRKRRKA